MAEIIIQLMSDLCAGNGESVGSGIDSDICTDNYGFPFIPGRFMRFWERTEQAKVH